MKISVAICTWNRCELLSQTLQQFRQVLIPAGIEWELIIIDNNSTDQTQSVIGRMADELPIRSAIELQQGHAFSRNKAIEMAHSDLMIWTDNDVLVSPDWITAYIDGADRHPDADFFGGKIVPVFETDKPDWLAATWEKCKPVYAARDLGDQEFQFSENQYPYGANFAVRTDVQKQFLFDTQHGRTAAGLMGNDEIDLLHRISRAGHHGFWLPKPELQHFIPDDRATESYVGKYFIGQGHTNVMRQKQMTNSRWQAWRTALHHSLCYRLKRKISQPDVWVSHLIQSSIAWGEYQTMFRLSSEHK